MILDFYSVKCLVRWIVGRIWRLERDVVKSLIIRSNFWQLFIPWLSNPLIIRLFPYLDYHESVILQKTSLKGLILIIKSTYQGWYVSLTSTHLFVGVQPRVDYSHDLQWCPVFVPVFFLGVLSSPFPSLTTHAHGLGFSFFRLTCGRTPDKNRFFYRRVNIFREKNSNTLVLKICPKSFPEQLRRDLHPIFLIIPNKKMLTNFTFFWPFSPLSFSSNKYCPELSSCGTTECYEYMSLHPFCNRGREP